jgi:hypothetical protein
MPKYQLHYKKKTFELSLFDDFYITIDDERLNNTNKLSCDIESILLSMMDNNMTCQQWQNECDIHFTVTKDGTEINPDDVQHDMIDNLIN